MVGLLQGLWIVPTTNESISSTAKGFSGSGQPVTSRSFGEIEMASEGRFTLELAQDSMSSIICISASWISRILVCPEQCGCARRYKAGHLENTAMYGERSNPIPSWGSCWANGVYTYAATGLWQLQNTFLLLYIVSPRRLTVVASGRRLAFSRTITHVHP